MYISLRWLSDYLQQPLEHAKIAKVLTKAGFPVESISNCGSAANLRLVQVVASDSTYTTVEDAKHTKYKLTSSHQLVALSVVILASHGQATADDTDTSIKICTMSDLGFGASDEVMVLPSNTPLDADLTGLLELDDVVMDFEVTSNRGDCLSIHGMARELAVSMPELSLPVSYPHTPISAAKALCPSFATRVITHIDNQQSLPVQITTRLAKLNINSINPVVDILNYVMLELGQPLHAYTGLAEPFDLGVRLARAGEELELLNGQQVALQTTQLLVTNQDQPIGLAGIMGGSASAVTSDSTSIILESAYFTPGVILGRARELGLTTEAATRFERGVDQAMQLPALERATQLILELLGGSVSQDKQLNQPEQLSTPIAFKPARCCQLLGCQLTDGQILAILENLGCLVSSGDVNWQVTIPSHRHDLLREIDLIEEVARIYGYDNIPALPSKVTLQQNHIASATTYHSLRQAMANQGFHEVISYSFTDPLLQSKLFKTYDTVTLENPFAKTSSEMQVSLLPGLLEALYYNVNRQVSHIKLFEIAKCFNLVKTAVQETVKFAAIVAGSHLAKQWDANSRGVDYYDLKQELINILGQFYDQELLSFIPKEYNFLHPKRSSAIVYAGVEVGFLGMLHPKITAVADAYVFECALDALAKPAVIQYLNTSKYPGVTRDLSFFLAKEVHYQQLLEVIGSIPCEFLHKVSIFDVYQDQQTPDQKSMAISIILKHKSRTLVEEEVNSYIIQVVTALEQEFNIDLRTN